MERWNITYCNRDAMLGEMPARYKTEVLEADTDGLDEKADEQEILHRLHHLIDEHTDGACVLTEAWKADGDANAEA